MKDKGLDRGLVQDFDTSAKYGKKHFFGLRKMFWDYLKKLNVPFFDACCTTASGTDIQPVGYDLSLGEIVRFNGTDWVPITAFTTTTTTTSTTTTTTTP